MIDNDQKTYIGTYKVYRVFKQSGRRQILRTGLTQADARAMVNRFPDKSTSMVVYSKQFYADKYFI